MNAYFRAVGIREDYVPPELRSLISQNSPADWTANECVSFQLAFLLTWWYNGYCADNTDDARAMRAVVRERNAWIDGAPEDAPHTPYRKDKNHVK